jgi:hypothetical protein
MIRVLLSVFLAFTFALSGSAAHAADGIPVNRPFKIPYQADGKDVTSRAVVAIDSKGDAILTVHFLSGDSIEEAVYSLVRNDGASPNPSPSPAPKPTPVANLWGIVIEESSQRTAEQAVVLTSAKIRDLFTDGGFRVVDQDTNAMSDVKPYQERAKGQKLPVLYLVDTNGTIYYEGSLPTNVAAMEVLVGKYKKGGAK